MNKQTDWFGIIESRTNVQLRPSAVGTAAPSSYVLWWFCELNRLEGNGVAHKERHQLWETFSTSIEKSKLEIDLIEFMSEST